MSELTAKQKQEIARRLDARTAELRQEIRDTLVRSGEQHYVDLAGRVTDTADESVEAGMYSREEADTRLAAIRDEYADPTDAEDDNLYVHECEEPDDEDEEDASDDEEE